jgi:hypothetical protein
VIKETCNNDENIKREIIIREKSSSHAWEKNMHM